MDLFTAQRILWLASVTAEVFLVGEMINRRLERRYPFFLAYLIIDAVSVLALMQIGYRSIGYAYAWRWYQVALLVLRLGAAGELFDRVSRQFGAIWRFRFYLAAILLAVASLVAVLLPFMPLGTGVRGYPQTLVMLFERWETTALEIALVLTFWFLAYFMRFPIALPRNLAAHWVVLTIYFGLDALFTTLALMRASLTARLAENLTLLVGEIGCFMLWLWLMREGGETVPEVGTMPPDEVDFGRALRRWIEERIQETRSSGIGSGGVARAWWRRQGQEQRTPASAGKIPL